MSAVNAGAPAVGSLVFGAYNIANVGLRQEKVHEMQYLFSGRDEKHIKNICGVFRKGLNFFGLRRMLGRAFGSTININRADRTRSTYGGEAKTSRKSENSRRRKAGWSERRHRVAGSYGKRPRLT